MVFRGWLHIGFAYLLMWGSINAQAQQLVGLTIIANNTGSSTLQEKQIIEVYKAKHNFWKNGEPVLLCLPDTKSTDAARVYQKIYGKSVAEVQKFWLSLVFQGRGKAPNFLVSDADMIEFVSRNPGSIGVFINEKNISIPSELRITVIP